MYSIKVMVGTPSSHNGNRLYTIRTLIINHAFVSKVQSKRSGVKKEDCPLTVTLALGFGIDANSKLQVLDH